MQRTRLALYLAAFAAWPVVFVLGFAGATHAAKVAAIVAGAITALAALAGILYALVTTLRRWRTEGLPTWRGRR